MKHLADEFAELMELCGDDNAFNARYWEIRTSNELTFDQFHELFLGWYQLTHGKAA